MRKLNLFILACVTIAVISINLKLHTEHFTKEEKANDILLQLNFLEEELKFNQLGENMQGLFPEGLVFVNALYGLAWCEFALAQPKDDALKKKAIEEALFAYHAIDTADAKINFAKFLKPEYGVFYAGWSTYLLSKVMAVDTSFIKSEHYRKTLQRKCDIIANAFEQSSIPFLESYPMQSWPADNFIAIAALANYDKTFTPRYKGIIEEWIKKVRNSLEPDLGMIAHQTHFENSKIIENSRGSSTTLILRMLSEIDPDFGNEQYKKFKKHFVETTFALPSVREYPKGEFGIGDIDSGPVIFGVGFAGTIVSIGTFAVYEDTDFAAQQYKTINAFGLVSKHENMKMYLFGRLPMADAFIAWGRATALKYQENDNFSFMWNWKFHLCSFLILILLWGVFFRKKLRKLISF
ncbi:hypothetical protein [Flammeovirga sp. SJP92]|uniref:hypothetical protein n=1 Tax=Flammeovirga sp. SJP92 TaxID=1775430 RepID=UPI0007874511|nr:hypothetical protein [Flammeovirga sp. SJP92]KXX68756.1 hypothetical protein AVL50_18970 [Flammeovirga sp. SJP92]